MKHPMKLKMNKLNKCEICNTPGYTELMHIFGRNKQIVNDPRNIIEGCKDCHKDENNRFTMERIRNIQNNKHKNWDEWALETAKIQGKHNWMEYLTRKAKIKEEI